MRKGPDCDDNKQETPMVICNTDTGKVEIICFSNLKKHKPCPLYNEKQ